MNLSENIIYPVVIVGAGIAGLVAQSVLQRHSVDSLIIEKSRGLGGRCATRRGPDFIADHGPQYLNSRLLASPLLKPDSIQKLKELKLESGSLHPRLIHPEGISQFAKLLSSAPQALKEERIVKITRAHISDLMPIYLLQTESGFVVRGKNIILTAPLPQSLALLKNLEFKDDQQEKIIELNKIKYDPCIAMILELSSGIHLGNSGIWKYCKDTIIGIYNQQEKGLATTIPTLVVHASPALSTSLWDQTTYEIEKSILAETLACLESNKISITIKKTHLHKWKYSEPQTLYPRPCVMLGYPHHECVLAGDAFKRSSIGGAFESGEAAALALMRQGL